MTETLVVSCLVLITTYFQDYMMHRMLNMDEQESQHQPK
jgi:hypothetical protein